MRVTSGATVHGRALARKYGYEWRTEVGEPSAALLVNATPIGMAGGEETDALPFPDRVVAAASVVFDVVAMPPDTPLIRAARSRELPVITGDEVIALQAALQFELYTGVKPTADQVRRASEFSRS